MTRIGFADHLFLRMHHGIGKPVFNQFLWWFDSTVPDSELRKLHANLMSGLLSREVVPPLLPTARHRWVASDNVLPIDFGVSPIEVDGLRRWAEQRAGGEIDPERGTGWQLSAAPVVGGGTIVSLVCSHMVADGAAMMAAVRRANGEAGRVGAADLGSRPSLFDAAIDDVADTVGQLRPILSWLGKKAARTLSRTSSKSAALPARTDGPHRRAVSPGGCSWTPPYVVVECPLDRWMAVASEWGGTSNSLFIGMLTAVSESIGRARPGDELRWSLPFNNRAADDLDSNSTKIIPVRVPVSEPGDRDLTRIRKASKTAFTEFAARQATGVSTDPIPLPLIQMLPDALVRRMPIPADGAEGLCSNLGTLPEAFTTIGGVTARSVAARATFGGADAEFARALGGGLTAWASETENFITISMHGMDPDRMATDEEMRGVVADVLDRWGVDYRFW